MMSDPLESLIIDFLYNKKEFQTQFFNGVGITEEFVRYAGSKGLQLDAQKDEARFREAVWLLVGKGLVVPGTSARGGGEDLPWISITQHGIKCFEAGTLMAYDPAGFIKTLLVKVPTLDGVVLDYTEEALSSFVAMNYLSTMVMMGAALERTILVLTEEFSKKLKGKKKAEFTKEVLSKEKIKTRFDNFLSFLDKHGYKKNFDRAVKEKLESSFPAIANIIRITRNEVGHPTGRKMDREEAEANLLLSRAAIIFSHELLGVL